MCLCPRLSDLCFSIQWDRQAKLNSCCSDSFDTKSGMIFGVVRINVILPFVMDISHLDTVKSMTPDIAVENNCTCCHDSSPSTL